MNSSIEHKNKITGIVITLNEEKNIQACIQSLRQVCSEVIVVDSGSSDATVKIAKSLKAKVIYHPFIGDGPQKNVGLQYASNNWILSLDADERISEEMARSINEMQLDNVDVPAYSFNRRNFIGSRWIKTCGWYPDRLVRLYDKRFTRYSEEKAHGAIEIENIIHLKVDILHYGYRNVGQLFFKADKFSSAGAKILYQRGKKAGPLSPFLHGLALFIRQYFFQRGFLGGVDGFTVALSGFVSAYLKYARLRELNKDPNVLKNTDFNSIW